jgi:hypothetical protein
MNARIELSDYDEDAKGSSVVAYHGGAGRKHVCVSLGAWSTLELGSFSLIGGQDLAAALLRILVLTPREEGATYYEEDHKPTNKALANLFWETVASDPKIARKVSKLSYKQGWDEGRLDIRKKFNKLMKVNW